MELPDFRLTIFFLLLFVSAFFSGSETSLFSFGRMGISELKQKNNKWVNVFEKIFDKPSRLLATILLGNEFTNVLITTIMASLSADYFGGNDWKKTTLLSVLITTPLLHIFAEVTPKTLAIKSPEQFSLIVIRPIYMLFKLFQPILNLLDILFKPFKKIFGLNTTELKTINEMSFLNIVDASSEEQEIETNEKQIIHNIFNFSDKIVNSVMTTRENVFFVRENDSLKSVTDGIRVNGFSRIPVLEKTGYGIKGILLAKDLLPYLTLAESNASLVSTPESVKLINSLLEPVISISAKSKLYHVFKMLKIKKMHIAAVVDEYGNMTGVLTMEDLLEELFGEISDERDV